jgi:uncharacterized protein
MPRHLTNCFLVCFIGLVLTFLSSSPRAETAAKFPPLTGRIVDEANIIDATIEANISNRLADLERKTSDQLVVVTINSLNSYDIADYGYQLGRTWGIGQKDKNNGVLLIVAPHERKVRIEVGYGLEGTLTDAIANNIIQKTMLPLFRREEFSTGIYAGVQQIIGVLSHEQKIDDSSSFYIPKQKITAFEWLLMILVSLPFLIIFITVAHALLSGFTYPFRALFYMIFWPTLVTPFLLFPKLEDICSSIALKFIPPPHDNSTDRHIGHSRGGFGGGGGGRGGGFGGGGGRFGGGGASGGW